MTTKNSEFVFNLQAFAMSDHAVIGSNSGNVTVGTGYDSVSESATIVTGTTTDTVVTGTGTDTVVATTDVTLTDTSWSTTYTFYAFNDTDTSQILQVTTDTAVATTLGSEAPSAEPTTTDTAKSRVSSPVTITGGTTQSTNIELNGVGTIPELLNNTNLALTAGTGNRVNLTGVSGSPVIISSANNVFNQTINGAAVNATIGAGNNLILDGSSSILGITADASVNLANIDANQNWLVGSNLLAYNRVGVSTSDTPSVTVTSGAIMGASNHLAVKVGEGSSVNVTTTASNPNDTVTVNDVRLLGAGRLGAAVTAGADGVTVAATKAGAFAANVASVGGAISSLSESGTAIVNASNDIVRASNLSSGATWTLGAGMTEATLGSDRVIFKEVGDTITADSTGNKVAGVGLSDSSTNVTLIANGDHNVSVRNSGGSNVAAWNIDVEASDASISAVFNQTGNLSLNTTDGIVELSSSTGNKTLNSGNADALVLSNGASVTITNGLIYSANSVAAGTDWTVRGGTGTRSVFLGSDYLTFGTAATDSVYGVLKTSSTSGASLTGIDSLSGNVTVNADTISGLNVAGTDWTIANPGYAMFNSTGNVATVIASDDDMSVASTSTDASVQVTMTADTMTGSFNGVSVHLHDSDHLAGVSLENATTGSGVVGITSLNSGATITGDNLYTINDQYTVYKAASNLANVNTQITLGSGDITVNNVVNGDNYNVTGGTVYYDINSTLYSGGTAAVTVNDVPVTISASTDSAVRNAYIVSNDDDALVSVGGVRVNDTVTTTTDTSFSVAFRTSNVDRAQSDTTKPYTMNVNQVAVSLVGTAVSDSVSAISMNVQNSDLNKPFVSISSGLANNATITVGAGYYVVGGNAAVEVNDSIGYLYINNNGGVTAEDYSVAQIRIDREESVHAAVDAISNTVTAYQDFYNVDYGSSKSFASSWSSTVAGYSTAATTSPTVNAVPGGVNIFGDTALGGHPTNVTLQSFIANPIKIDHTEGIYSGAEMRTAVIDVSNGNASLIAIGMDDNYSTFATNHSILGSARQSTIAIGDRASGNNVVKGGNGGNYIYHNAGSTGGVSSLYGGSGSDTIYAGPSDHVEGGTGKDYFFDSSPVEISDYNFEEGDVIIATKLSASAALTLDKLKLSGNKISVADGSTITVGASENYDESTATRAVIANAANNASTNFLVWSGNYESFLDASNFTKGALMVSDINDARADTIAGSSYVDTIYAGANDYVDAGSGNDIISLSSISGSNGASVVLANGMNSVVGWRQGFDNTAGANVLIADPQSINFKTKNEEVVAYAENSSISFNGLTTIDGAYRFLVGSNNSVTSNKFSYIAANTTASVNTNADVGDYYKAERNGGIYVGADVTTQFEASLGTSQFLNVTKMDLHNESRATVWGSSANETITVNGSRDNGARKYVAAGAGNDVIISGGNSTVNAGNNLYFGTSGGTVFSSGRDTVQNFNFYKGGNNDPDMSGADLLYLGDKSRYNGVNVTANQVEISLGEDKVIIRDDGGFSNSDNKIMRVQFDSNTAPISNIKLGISGNVNSFTYDGETDYYWGNTSRARDTLNVASELSNVNIWLNDKNYDNNTYGGIGVINASSVADTKLTLAGSADNNVIYAGGNNTSSSLWGGGGEANTLVGGNGEETFFYFKNIGYTDNDGNYHASRDTFDRVSENDLIWLYDVTLNDIDYEKTQSGITNNKITVTLTDGTEIGVTNMSTNTNFRISNGQGGWTDVRAINSGNNRHWE